MYHNSLPLVRTNSFLFDQKAKTKEKQDSLICLKSFICTKIHCSTNTSRWPMKRRYLSTKISMTPCSTFTTSYNLTRAFYLREKQLTLFIGSLRLAQEKRTRAYKSNDIISRENPLKLPPFHIRRSPLNRPFCSARRVPRFTHSVAP